MAHQQASAERRTGAASVFDHLYDEIVSMRLLPGAKISEAEIAKRFEVSRQPVRDAFTRLENLDLLLIRPQKATEVKQFSNRAIATSRFVRLSVECEVLRRAARSCSEECKALLLGSIDDQAQAVEQRDGARFRALDYEFHKTLCSVGDVEFAFEVISAEKAKLDRLCVLELEKDDRLDQLLQDHKQIAMAISNRDENSAVDAGVKHLSRLDSTIASIQTDHADYFAP